MDYENLALDELAVLARDGDEEALRMVYARSRDMLRGKANLYFMVGADRDDVMQEGMIGLLGAIRSFEMGAGASFRTYAELCVKRHIINAVKMAGRQKHRPLNESLSIDAAVRGDGGGGDDSTGPSLGEVLRAPDWTNPEEIVLLADLRTYVEGNAPALFSGMEREVWELYVQGASAAQISERTGRTAESVGNALTRIKGKIGRLVSLY